MEFFFLFRESKIKSYLGKSIEISLGDVTVMDVNSVDPIQINNEEENPLESEEPMSFSPLPGSFTEQLNLDTFEFSFEPL